jgi:hypothetical protein
MNLKKQNQHKHEEPTALKGQSMSSGRHTYHFWQLRMPPGATRTHADQPVNRVKITLGSCPMQTSQNLVVTQIMIQNEVTTVQ